MQGLAPWCQQLGKPNPARNPPPHPLLHPPLHAPPWGTPLGPGRSPAGERQEERLGEMEQRWRLQPASVTVPDPAVDAAVQWDPPPPRSTRRGRRCGRARRTAGTPPACSALSLTAGCCPWGYSCPMERGQSQGHCGCPCAPPSPSAHRDAEKMGERGVTPPLPSWIPPGAEARSPKKS